MGDQGLIQIPITDGIDQRASAVVGPFRIQRLERARYLQPGEVVASPGYAYASGTIDATDRKLRAVGHHNTFGAYAVYSGLLSTGYFGACLARRDYDMSWRLDETSRVSPVEAPRRIRIDINQDATTAIPPQVIPTTLPNTVVVATSERVSVYTNGVFVRSGRFPSISGDDGVYLRAAGRAMFDKVGSLWSYSVASDTWTRHISRTGTFDFVSAVAADSSFGVPGLTGYGCSIHLSGNIRVYSWNGISFALIGTLPPADLPVAIGSITDISAAFAGGCLVRVCITSAHVIGLRLYTVPTLGITAEYTYDVTSTATPVYPVSLSGDQSGNLWLAYSQSIIDSKYSSTLVDRVVFTTGGVTAINAGAQIDGHIFDGVIFGAPAPNGVFVVTRAGSTCLWCVDGGPGDGSFQWPNCTATLCTWWGFDEGTVTRAQVCCAAVASEFDGSQTQQIFIPYRAYLLSVASGNELVTIKLGKSQYGTPVIPCSGSGAPSSGVASIDAYQRAGDVVGGGYPFALGNRIDSAGLGFLPRTPILAVPSGPTGDTGFMSDGTYQYVMVLETLDSMGNIIRSAPSLPATITLSGGGTNQAVHVYFSERPPQLPGVDSSSSRWVIYRTLANGTVFYNCSQGSYKSNYSQIGFTDKNSDSDISSNNILYSQGQSGAISGQKANYAIPPCRCIWQGRDRYIIGGLDKPRRVRFSKLFVDGERAQFTHPSEAQWSADVDDDVTAVAQLDEAWLVFCGSSAYAIYGAGPDDTGGNGEFETPRCISRQIGCHSWRSLCEIPEGMLFQGQDSIIYLVMRGTLQIVSWSEKVRNLLVNIATGQSLGWVSSVVRHETRGTIHFVRNSGATLVYNTVTSSWSLDTDWASEGLTGAISACQARVFNSSTSADHYTDTFPTIYIATESGRILYEGCNNGADMSLGPDGTVKWTPFLESNDMALWGLMGWGTTTKLCVMVGHGYKTEAEYPVNGEVYLTTWNSDEAQHDPTAPSDTVQFFPAFSGPNDYRTLSAKTPKPTSSSRRLRIEWGGEKLVGITLDGEKLSGSERNTVEERA